jgi:2-dehydropantoate 2-reductase
MRILVVGAGSTGGYYGARLANAGRDVTFLVRAARREQLQRDGLQVVSQHGDLTLQQPQLVTADELNAPYDVLLFTVKAFAMDAAIADIAPAVGPATMILPVLNGMHHIAALVARFGETPVLGGVAFISTEIDARGRIVQLNAPHDLMYGERSGERTERVLALDALMQNAGFTARLSTRIVAAMWEKWQTLASLGGITCTMRGTIGDIVAAPGGLDFINAFFSECKAIATAAGFPPDEAFHNRTHGMLTTAGSPLTSSMYRDLVSGSDVEADQILGDLLVHASTTGTPAPLLSAAYANLKVYQSRR